MSGRVSYADWIAVDWGTSRLRAWAMGAQGEVQAEASSDDGMGRLTRDGFEPALLKLIDPWLGNKVTPVIACGMVGSRQGWAEAAYAPVPCPPLGGTLTAAPTRDPRIEVRLVPGVKQPAPADVMRGEETQIAGLLHVIPDFDGVACLPGTHTKWAHVSAGEIVSFRTFMTGEVFELLSRHSVLRHGLGDGWDSSAFDEAVSESMSRPEAIAARLFSIRAEMLLNDLGPAAARARLSGLLLGIELAAAKSYWLGRRIALIGAQPLCQHYASALGAQGVSARIEDGSSMTRAGLAAAYDFAKEFAK